MAVLGFCSGWMKHRASISSLAILSLFFSLCSLRAVEIADCREAFLSGKYEKAVELAQAAIDDGERDEEWRILQARSYVNLGRYEEAQKTISEGLKRVSWSVRLRLLGHEAFLRTGNKTQAEAFIEEINELGGTRRWTYRDSANLVALGKTAILLGVDARLVLDNFFEPAKKADPEQRDAYLAGGELALSKHDFALAAKNFQEGLKKFPKDADFHWGLAMAFAPDDRAKMIESLEKALEHNPRHAPSLLQLADHFIDCEQYKEAEEHIAKVLEIDARHPEAWAYRSVIQHLQGNFEAEEKARSSALADWNQNPRVEHLIGLKLSQKYRFAEGAAHQRKALEFEPEYTPAQGQLAQDLLRLGEEEEGWRLAEKSHAADGYDVVAYNLITLKDSMSKFATITNEHFILRMSSREAAIYGRRALALLEEARSTLCRKYGFELKRPTIVEIFPEQKDFAVRTFGMPGGAGYLGVCFGSVITANSPASSTGRASNWEAVLWHEFCHVVTLQMTENKMPRWLSEGISVFEELQRNPAWGQRMDPQYREMILEGELKPIQEMSAAFLTPPSGLHLQFAYYQSSLIVEFIVQKYGLEKLKNILADLRRGVAINETLEKNTESFETLEKEFAAAVKKRAETLGGELTWEKPKGRSFFGLDESEEDFARLYPHNYYALKRKAQKLIEEKKWEEAKPILENLIEKYPEQTGDGNAYELAAKVYRELKQPDLELRALEKLSAQDAESVEAYARLMELGQEKGQWEKVVANADRYLAVNPLAPQPYRHLAKAKEQLGKPEEAIEACHLLLMMDPPDPADLHFRMATLWKESEPEKARRAVLRALEEAPRFRQAHDLLLQLQAKSASAKAFQD